MKGYQIFTSLEKMRKLGRHTDWHNGLTPGNSCGLHHMTASLSSSVSKQSLALCFVID